VGLWATRRVFHNSTGRLPKQLTQPVSCHRIGSCGIVVGQPMPSMRRISSAAAGGSTAADPPIAQALWPSSRSRSRQRRNVRSDTPASLPLLLATARPAHAARSRGRNTPRFKHVAAPAPSAMDSAVPAPHGEGPRMAFTMQRVYVSSWAASTNARHGSYLASGRGGNWSLAWLGGSCNRRQRRP
jgi:hypothetical protein